MSAWHVLLIAAAVAFVGFWGCRLAVTELLPSGYWRSNWGAWMLVISFPALVVGALVAAGSLVVVLWRISS
jgi:hypothetical protein